MTKGPDPRGGAGGGDKRRSVLGRGLSALIPPAPVSVPAASAPAGSPAQNGKPAGAEAAPSAQSPHAAPAPNGERRDRSVLVVGIEEVTPRKDQPRRRFEETPLDELADSIRAHGIIQPLVVSRDPQGTGFRLIAGERRWRAAQRAGLKEVPVVVREATDEKAFELALVENIQRQDLNPLEEAEAYQRLLEEHGYTQEELAKRVGKDRATVANAVRLLKLPPSVRELVADGRLSMGHARALLGAPNIAKMEVLARRVVDRQLSVRATEELVRRAVAEAAGEKTEAEAEPASEGSAESRDLEARLMRALQTRVRLVADARHKGRGRLEIHYHSLHELDRLLDRLLPG